MPFICVICQELLANHPHSDQNSFRDSSSSSSRGNADTADIVAVKCGHVFHLICLNNWFDTTKLPVSKQQCPQCRAACRAKILKIFLSTDDATDFEGRKEVEESKKRIGILNVVSDQLTSLENDSRRTLEVFHEVTTDTLNLLQNQIRSKVEEIVANVNASVQDPSVRKLQDRKNESRTSESELEIVEVSRTAISLLPGSGSRRSALEDAPASSSGGRSSHLQNMKRNAAASSKTCEVESASGVTKNKKPRKN